MIDKGELVPNSQKSKAEAVASMSGKAQGKPAKKNLGVQVKEAFVGEDAKASGSYFVDTVVVPAAKIAASDVLNAALDAVRAGFNLLIFGDTSSPSGKKGGARFGYQTGNVNYSGISTVQASAPKVPSPGKKAVYDAAKVTFGTREEAEDVLATLRELLSEYPDAGVTVDDLYSIAEMDNGGNQLLAEYGWLTLDSAVVRRIREGWLLSLPNPIKLDIR